MKTYQPLTDLLRELEERLLQPGVRGSKDEVGQLLADDFREFGASGRIYGKREAMQALQVESGRQFALSDFRATAVSPGVVLATYRVTSTDTVTGVSSSSLRSSVWKKLDGKWRLIFHQGA